MQNATFIDNRIESIFFDRPRDFREIWELQKKTVSEILSGTVHEKILLLEHKPVYTIGFHGDINNLHVTEESLKRSGIEVIRIERGGDITFHGPGQLVVYPLIDLRKRKLGVKDYVAILEESVIRTCNHIGIRVNRIDGATGVWCGNDMAKSKKICAIGVKISHGVTMHGLALNVSTDLSWFNMINPCGFSSFQVTTMEECLNGETPHFTDIAHILNRELLNLLENK